MQAEIQNTQQGAARKVAQLEDELERAQKGSQELLTQAAQAEPNSAMASSSTLEMAVTTAAADSINVKDDTDEVVSTERSIAASNIVTCDSQAAAIKSRNVKTQQPGASEHGAAPAAQAIANTKFASSTKTPRTEHIVFKSSHGLSAKYTALHTMRISTSKAPDSTRCSRAFTILS